MKILGLMVGMCLVCMSSMHAAAEVKPEMVLQVGHLGQITDLTFSPDGKTLASAARGVDYGFGEVKLWDAQSGELQRDLNSVLKDCSAVAFSPSGKALATASLNGPIQLWDVQSGALQRTLAGHEGGTISLLFRDENTLVSAGGYYWANGEVFLWNPANGQKIRTISEVVKISGEEAETTLDTQPAMALSRNRQTLVNIMPRKARVWRVRDWKLLRTINFPNDSTSAFEISSDGRTLVIGLEQDAANVRFYDVETGKLKRSWQMPNGHPTSFALSPDSRTLIGSLYGGGGMGLVRWWRTDNGREIRTQQVAEYSTEIVKLSPDGSTLATGAGMWEAGVKLWNATTGKLKTEPVAQSDDIQALAFAPGGKFLGVAQNDNTVRLWSLERGTLEKTLDAAEDLEVGDVNLIAFSPDGSTLVAGGGRNFYLHLWNWRTAQRGPALDFKRSFPDSAMFSPDGKILAATFSDSTTRLWNPQTGALLRTLSNAEQPGSAIHGVTAFSHDGELLATSGKEGFIHFWNPQTGDKLFNIKHFSVERAEFSRDNTLLAADDWHNQVSVHDVRTHKTLWQSKNVLDFAWMPDGQSLWCRNDDGTISRHDAKSGQTLQSWSTLTGNERVSEIEDDVTAWLTISPNGKILAGKSDDQSIKLWDADNGRLLLTFRTLPTLLGMTSQGWIAWTPDGFYTGSPNCEKWIRWRVEGKLLPAEQYAKKFLSADKVRAALQAN